jgi:hypothetical protein
VSVLNKNSMRNKFLFWVGVILIWAGVITGTLWSKGYQYQSSRSLTDEEIIRIAVYRTMQRMQVDTPKVIVSPSEEGSTFGFKFFRPAFIVSYRDTDHFLEENPKCCTVHRDDGGKFVTIYGKVFYKDRSGQIHSSETRILRGEYFPYNIRYLP